MEEKREVEREQETVPDTEGSLVGDKVIVNCAETRRQLELRGYGEDCRDGFCLRYFEALYLLYVGRLKLYRGGKIIDFDRMMKISSEINREALVKFLIYRDLRARGYTVKDGFGFGADFRVYERGGFGSKGSKYLVFGMSEGKQESVGSLQKKISAISKMGKEPIIAVVERRGEVIYYRVSGIAFRPNKHRPLKVKK